MCGPHRAGFSVCLDHGAPQPGRRGPDPVWSLDLGRRNEGSDDSPPEVVAHLSAGGEHIPDGSLPEMSSEDGVRG